MLFCASGCDQDTDRLRPVSYQLPENGAALLVVDVAWPFDGACIDQFEATVVESKTEIEVRDVLRTEGNGDCSDIGTDGRTLSVPAELSAPVGDRSVVTEDGQPLSLR